MPIQGEIKTLYKNKNNTSPIFPTTKVKAVSDENGIGLDALLRDNYATKTYVTSEIAKAQVGGDDSEIDLSGFATKDYVDNIKHPISSVNNKTGEVVLTAEDVGARPNTWMPTPADIGAAPAGYGLGAASNAISHCDLNDIVENGWYCFNSNSEIANIPENKPSLLFVESFYNTNYCKQTVTVLGTKGVSYMRMRHGGVWGAWKTLAEAHGSAPAGYGLGLEVSPEITDANQAVANGWYRCSQNVANVPPVWHNGGWIFVESYNSMYKKQTYTHEVHGSFIATRIMTNGNWHEWEFVNPPMANGVEYRTTERYCGMPVYAMLVDCGNMPDGDTFKFVEINVNHTGWVKPISCVGQTSANGALPIKYVDGNEQWIGATVGYYTGTIRINMYGGVSTWTATALVKYVKLEGDAQ